MNKIFESIDKELKRRQEIAAEEKKKCEADEYFKYIRLKEKYELQQPIKRRYNDSDFEDERN